MILHVLFGVIKHENTFEALEVMDENSYLHNAKWIYDKLDKYKNENYFNLQIVEIETDFKKIDSIMFPA